MCFSQIYGAFLVSSEHIFSFTSMCAPSTYTNAEQTSLEVKIEVQQQLQEKERIEQSLPSSIVIGPFIVRVEAVRQALSNKRKTLANSMLGRLAQKLRKQVDDVSNFLEARKLFCKSKSIERNSG